MTTQQAVTASIAYAPETTFGVAALPANGRYLRRVQSTLALSKDTFTSNEVRPDQQIADMRHGLRKVGGAVSAELSNGSFDDLIAAMMRSTWSAGVSATQADFTGLTASAANATLTAAAGSWLAKGFKVGDVLRLDGITGANLNTNFRITRVTAAAVTVYPAPADMASQANFTVTVAGEKVSLGTLKPSFTIEQIMPDIDVSELFTGVRVDKGTFQLPVTGMATVDFDLVGQNGQILEGGASPYYTAPAAASTTGVLAGPSGSLTLNGVAQAVVTALSFSVAHSCTAPGVVGSVVTPDIYYGRMQITGTISAYLTDASLLKAFLNETESDITVQLNAAAPADGSAPDFLCFGFHRVKFTGATHTLAGDGGVIVQMPFQSLITNSADTDVSSMTIQRSNA